MTAQLRQSSFARSLIRASVRACCIEISVLGLDGICGLSELIDYQHAQSATAGTDGIQSHATQRWQPVAMKNYKRPGGNS